MHVSAVIVPQKWILYRYYCEVFLEVPSCDEGNAEELFYSVFGTTGINNGIIDYETISQVVFT